MSEINPSQTNNDAQTATALSLEIKIFGEITDYLKKNSEDLDDERYKVVISYILRKTEIDNIVLALKKHKKSGKVGSNPKIGDVEVFLVRIFDSTAKGSLASKPVDSFTINYGELDRYIALDEFAGYLKLKIESRNADRINRSVTSSASELKFKSTKNTATKREAISTAIVFSEAVYSSADKQFFKWWAKDTSGNIYLRSKEGLVMCPIREGEDKLIKLDSDFWTLFWKTYRNEIIEMYKKVIAYCWDLRYRIDSAEVSETLLRRKVDEVSSNSFILMLHQWLPKCWMNRMAVILNSTETTYKDEDNRVHTDYNFEGFELGFFPNGNVTMNPQPCTDENWEKMLAYAVPRIDTSEIETAKNFTNSPSELAIHRVQIGQFVRDSKTPQDLPPTWKMFFETRLGKNLNSQLYRIAKWICSCLDATNFSRKVLVVAGHGADGKSLFQSVLMDGFNMLANSKSFAKVLPSMAVNADNTQNGLLECMDSRVLMTPDVTRVTEYLKTEVVKNITGCDYVTAQVKYRNPVSKSMSGTKLMVTTNSTTYLSDVYVDSRVSPIFFDRTDTSYDWDVIEIKKKLLDEFADFISWAFYFSYAKDDELGISHHVDPEIWSESAISSEIKDQWEAIGRDDDPSFVYRKADENSADIYEDICHALNHVIKVGESLKCTNSDIREALSTWCKVHMPYLKFSNSGTDKPWKVVIKCINDLYGDKAAQIKSNGIRCWKGISVTDEFEDKSIGKSSRPSTEANVSPDFPAI